MKYNPIKWRLMLRALPIAITFILIKVGLCNYFEFDGLVKFSEIGLVVTGGMFLLGFMLAGTLSDYKESEKIPADLATTLESLEDTINLAHRFKGGFSLSDAKENLHAVTNTILEWFHNQRSVEDVFTKISGITDIALTLENAGVGAIASRISSEQHNLRKQFSRVSVIRRTNFLATGYAMLEVISAVIVVLLLISTFESVLIAIIITGFVVQIFFYMIYLIRDLDEPFEYNPSGKVGAADVDLCPLVEYHQRLSQRLMDGQESYSEAIPA